MSGKGALKSVRSLLSLGRTGVYHFRGAPQFGQQDVGISPGGPLDLFSMQTGNLLLGNDPDHEALEIVYPPSIEFLHPCYFVLAGAHWQVSLELPGGEITEVSHAVTGFVPAGARLRFLQRTRGFRAYLCLRACSKAGPRTDLLHRSRGDFMGVFSWPDPLGKIRVLEGPEHSWLETPEAFTARPWMVSRESSDMGMRLEGSVNLNAMQRNMISDAVADGTVQLSPSGPLVLLRHRQTVGGYPRIFNVISADVDLLAQFPPGRPVRFRVVDLPLAVEIARRKKAELEGLLA